MDRRMDEIAGEYVLKQFAFLGKNPILPRDLEYTDLNAEVVEIDGRWFFCCDLPIEGKGSVCSLVKIKQPVSWSPLLGEYIVPGDNLSFASRTGYDTSNSHFYFDTKRNKIGLNVAGYSKVEGNRIVKWYDWRKK